MNTNHVFHIIAALVIAGGLLGGCTKDEVPDNVEAVSAWYDAGCHLTWAGSELNEADAIHMLEDVWDMASDNDCVDLHRDMRECLASASGEDACNSCDVEFAYINECIL